MKQIVSVLPQGPSGLSAYQLALKNGFVGTEAEWLAELVGPQGPQGVPGSDANVTQTNMTAALADKPSWRGVENSDITYAHDADAAEAGLEPGDVYFNGSRLRAIPEHHPAVLAYDGYLRAADKIPADAAAYRAFLVRASAAYRELDGAGLLDDLVLSVYYGTDGNATGANHITFQGASPVASGAAPTADTYGMTLTQAAAQYYDYAVPDTRSGTMAYAMRGQSAQTAFGYIAHLGPAGGGASHSACGLSYNGNGGFVRAVSQGGAGFVVTGDFTGAAGNAGMWHSFTRDELNGIVSFGAASGCKAWVEGVPFTPAPATMANSGDPCTVLTIGARKTGAATWDGGGKGRYTAVFLFSRVLTDAEARAAHRALLYLRKTEVLLITEGDSTTGRTFTDTNHNWPSQLTLRAGWENVRVVNLAYPGDTAQGFPAQFAAQGFPSVRHPFARTKLVCVKGGINDRGSRTPAQIYADLLTVLGQYAAYGFTPTAMTNAPITGVPAGEAQVVADVNVLLRAGVAAGDFSYLADPALLLPHDGSDAAYWQDGLHPNFAGYGVQAQTYDEAVPLS